MLVREGPELENVITHVVASEHKVGVLDDGASLRRGEDGGNQVVHRDERPPPVLEVGVDTTCRLRAKGLAHGHRRMVMLESRVAHVPVARPRRDCRPIVFPVRLIPRGWLKGVVAGLGADVRQKGLARAVEALSRRLDELDAVVSDECGRVVILTVLEGPLSRPGTLKTLKKGE